MTHSDAARVPSGTDTRFLLLVMAVLASSIGAFYLTYASIHAKRDLMKTPAKCVAAYKREIAGIPDNAWAHATVVGPAMSRMNACAQPFYQDRAGWIVSGLAAECLIAVLLYLLHPWWIARRRRLRPLAGPEAGKLVEDLDGLAREMGLRRAPAWMVDPYTGTAGAQAFGLPWRPRVSLDAGLIIRHCTDPLAARAVVVHELAHIRNRDVAKTYLTIAVWRTFLLVPLPLLIIFTLHPGLLTTPLRWNPQRGADGWLFATNAAAIAVLSIVVYLARNAILRSRELHADALAVLQPAGQALRSTVGSLPWPPPGTPFWLRRAARVGTHPSPDARIDTIDHPSHLARISLWEFAGIGFTASLITQNFDTIAFGLSRLVASAEVLGALPAGLLIAGYLALTVWRVTAAGPAYRPRLPIWLAGLTAMTAGVAAAIPVPLFAAITERQFLAPVNLGAALLAFLLGAATLTAWLASTMRAAQESGTTHRWMRVIVGVAAAIGGALFAVWHLSYYTTLISTVTWGATPSPGHDIGWYTAVAKVTGVTYQPLLYLTQNPLLIPAVLALWLPPLILLVRSRSPQQDASREPFSRAMLIGAVAGLAAVLAVIASVLLAKAVLPETVRTLGDIRPELMTNSGAFVIVQGNVDSALFLLATAVAVAVVTARSARLRPALAALTVSTVAIFGGLGYYAVGAVSRCTDLIVKGRCSVPSVIPDVLGGYIQYLLLRGILVAVPAALLGVAIHRRHHPALPQPPVGRSTSIAATAVVLTLTAAAVSTATAKESLWIPPPTPAAVANSPDPAACVLGTWTETDVQADTEITDVGTVHLHNSGGQITYHADRVTYDYTGRSYLPTTANGHRIQRTKTGAVTQRFTVAYSVIRSYPDQDSRATGITTVTIDGVEQPAEPNSVFEDIAAYTCLGDTMHQSGPDFEETLRRVSH